MRVQFDTTRLAMAFAQAAEVCTANQRGTLLKLRYYNDIFYMFIAYIES